MLLWFQNQVETEEPSERIVRECLRYLKRFEALAAQAKIGVVPIRRPPDLVTAITEPK